ncbi:hypothetical protein Dimus_008524 [Dionaea muscipula]
MNFLFLVINRLSFRIVFFGMYFGFLTVISLSPSYLLLFRAQVREKGIEKKSAALNGVVAGQLIMRISSYYGPLHLVLGRPHLITLLVIPYLMLRLFHNFRFFLEDPKRNIPRVKRRSILYFMVMYKCTLYSIFWDNLFFQFFNYCVYPNSTLFRLVNIYHFRCNNNDKVLFIISNFFGWLIGQVVVVKCLESLLNRMRKRKTKFDFILCTSLIDLHLRNLVESHLGNLASELKYRYLGSELRTHIDPFLGIMKLVLVWIWKHFLIRPITLIKSNKSLMKEWNYFRRDFRYIVGEVKYTLAVPDTIFSLLLFVLVAQILVKTPIPILTSSLYKSKKKQKRLDEKRKKRRILSGLPAKDEDELDLDEDDEDENKEKKDKTEEEFSLEEEILTTYHLYDIYQCYRPIRYINKKKRGGRAVRNETSQYFFYPCKNDGKQRLSFTYPRSFSIFWKIIQATFDTIKNLNCDELNSYDSWISTNEEKK